MKKLAILTIALGLAARPASALAEEPPGPAVAARAFVEAASKGEFERATKNFDATMKKVMPADKLEEFWKALVGQVGPLKKITGARPDKKKGKYDIVYVACEFEKRKLDVRVALDGERRVSGFALVPPRGVQAFKAPPYARPESFAEQEAVVGSGPWKLPGTLTLPKGDGPFAAVVLVHGSGPHDRDETIGPNKPLRDLAWGLASKGVATLRYEKRTHAHSQEMSKIKDTITVKEEVVDDALAAVTLLRKTDRIDPKRISVLGHSLGATMAPRVAEREPAVAGIILLAGNQRPLEDLILEQVTYLTGEKPTDAQKKRLEKLKKQVARVKDPKLTAETPASDLPLGMSAPYWLALRAYDQAATAARLKQPVLILQGERDYQVTLADFAGWKKALAGKKNARLKSYPTLNHLFMAGKGKATSEEYDTAGHVDEVVVNDIAAWILGR